MRSRSATCITVALDRTVRVLKVTGFNERRGDAASARVLYEELGERKEQLIAL